MVSSAQQAKAIFLKLADLVPPNDWEACLDDECAGDEALKDRVRALLRAHANPSTRLNEDGLGITLQSDFGSPADMVGQRIGPYKLLEVIGEGGMGTVYMAEQIEPVHRRVALKLIKTGMDTRQVVARFEAERQALAVMDHPNIARVLDAGATESGRPYFVMELVKGQKITQFCDDQKLDTESRLKLFQQVCHAVQHAHQKGIIHRDIKPSNVLVAMYDDQPVPKVIDFGVAKATGEQLTEKTMFTRFGQIVGTLEYMSPEQAQFNQLDIDTRSDIYSLGAILYELLTGEPPFERDKVRNQPLDETLRMIREEEPTKPSTKLSGTAKSAQVASNRKTSVDKLGSTLRGDLDWIVMKALDKDRSRRYETANGLALDVQRYQRDEPISAGPPSVAYRFRKFARRNSGKLVAASLIAGLLVVGTSVSVWQAIRASHAEADAIRVAERAVEAEQLAAKREQQALQEMAISTAVRDFLNDRILAQATPSKQLDPNITLREVLDQAAIHIDAELTNQPLVKAEIHATISDSYRHLGRYEEALRHIERARTLFESELGGDDIQTLSAKAKQGLLLIRADRVQPAVDLLESTWVTAQNLFNGNPVTFEIAHALAIAYKNSGKYEDSRGLFQSVLRHRMDEFGAADYRTFATRNNLAIVLLSEGRLDEAEQAFLEIATEAGQLFPETHPVRRKTMSGLAKTYELQGNLAKAEELQREVVRISESIFGRRNMIWATEAFDLAGTLKYRGNYSEAIDLLNQISGFLKSAIRDDTDDRENRDRVGLNCKVHEQLSDAHSVLWEYQQSLDCLVSAYEESERALGKTDGNTIRMLSKLVNAASRAEYFRGIDTGMIDDLGGQIEDLAEAANHLDSPERESVKWNVGLLALRNDQPELAQQVFEGLIQHFESESYAPDIRDRHGIRLAAARCNLGNALQQQEDFEASIDVYLVAQRELEQALDANPDEASAKRFLFNTLHGLARSYTDLGNRKDSMATWDAVISNAPEARRVNYEILKANSLARLGDHAQATRHLEELAQRRLPGKNLINIAIGYCHCVNAVENDRGLAVEERRILANQHKATAIEFVKNATADVESLEQAYGLPRIIDELDSNSDFDPIRDEPDFKASVDSLKTRLKDERDAIQPARSVMAND